MKFQGHSFKIKGPGKDGKYVGRCSCGWTSFNKDKNRLIDSWNRSHINKYDNWK